MINTIQENWLDVFRQNLSGTLKVKIISPFVSKNMVDHLVKEFKGEKIQLITRFNLNDFRSGVSSLNAIEVLLKHGVEIKGIQDLHTKMYLFDYKSVIITSANFTSGGFFNNREFGVITDESQVVNNAQSYFEELWRFGQKLLEISTLEDWANTIKKSIASGSDSPLPKLPDFGFSKIKKVLKGRRYFIKFFGTGNDRAEMDKLVEDSIRYGIAHYAISFSKAKNDKRPTRYRDGDIVFMAEMSKHGQNDYSIFARGVAIKHDRKRDVAGPDDFNHVEWTRDWPILVRVKDVRFINGTYADCPKMNDLISDLDYECFESTLNNYDSGKGNFSPKQALMQKADVRLSESGALWIEERFEKAILKKGSIPEDFINQFYRGIQL